MTTSAAVVAAVVLLLGAAPAATAAEQAGQVLFGGQGVPGATITATQGEKKVVTVSDREGVYRFADLPDGAWLFQVEMLGFKPLTREVSVGGPATPQTWELELLSFDEMAQRAQRVTIAATPADAPGNRDTPAPATGGGVTAGAAADANANRGFERTPVNAAARTNPALSAENATPAEAAEAADSLVINGSVNNSAASPFAQPAAFGNNRRRPGALYNGSAGLLIGDSAWDSRPRSVTGGALSRQDYSDVHFFGTFGGPLKIPGVEERRPTFFIGFQHASISNASSQSTLMPSMQERAGDFSQSRDAFGRQIQIVDPLTGQPFPNNTIPQDRLSPQAQALLRYYPEPNVPGAGRNYQSPVFLVSKQDSLQSRILQPIDDRNQVVGTVAWQRTLTDSTSIFGFEDASEAGVIDASLRWTRRFNQFLSMRPRYQFTQTNNETLPHFSGRTNVSGEAGILGNDQSPVNWGPPSLSFRSGIEGLRDDTYSSLRHRAHTAGAEGYWTRSRHNFTFGGELRVADIDIRSQEDPRGRFGFTGAISGYDFADFLLGLPQTASLASGNADKDFRSTSFALYLTDDLRLTPSLTVNLGVRWEYESPITEGLGRLVNLDLADDFSAAAPVLASAPRGSITGRSYDASLLRPDRGGIQPRTALAWRPWADSSLIVRAGYGVYRNTNVYQSLATQLAQQPPLSRTFSVESSAAAPLTLAAGFSGVTPTQVFNTFAIDPAFRVGYAHNWQVLVQRDLPGSLTMAATYLGTRGSHLMQQVLPNTYPPGAGNPCPTCPAGFIYLTSSGSQVRHAAQLQVRRRLRNGLTWNVQYMLAKSEDDATAFSEAASGGAFIAQNWLDLDAEWGPSSFDQRHKVTAEVQYSTGVGAAGGGLLTGWRARLFGGWTFTGAFSAGSGLPVTPVYLTQVPGTGVIGSVRASIVGDVNAVPDGYYLNPAAYAPPAAGTWGTAGRHSGRGPSQFQLDAGITRTFSWGNRLTFDWRVDATNILNRVTYSAIGTAVGTPQFGLPLVIEPMRKLTTKFTVRF